MFNENAYFAIREALIELMQYCPRTKTIGGIENYRVVSSGEAICKVLDKCDAALKLPL